MNVGWVGLGKLGLPIAEEIARHHDVLGYDIRPVRTTRVIQTELRGLLHCDVIFVSVQTPHGPEYEGVTRIPETRADFDYTHLTDAVRALAECGPARPPLMIVSTVLPGTIEREILPLWNGLVVYNPFFIAMGEEVDDFLHPEFVLFGVPPLSQELQETVADLARLYVSLGVMGPFFALDYREAELAKMAYNTFIGLKIAFANTIGELADRLGANAGHVLEVLRAGGNRIISGRYLDPGMGDGGPCHPRDNIALSWLARETGMSFDLFGAVMEQRERHAEWLAGRVEDVASADVTSLGDTEQRLIQINDVTVLGRSYKPGTALETGSPALLVAELLRERGIRLEHVEDL